MGLHRGFIGMYGGSALLFFICAALTVRWCMSMSSMCQMEMPGGWTMSMAWMRMPGQTWLGMMASFLAMWVVMMVAMMLPSLAPTLWRYRRALSSSDEPNLDRLTAFLGLGYFFVWAIVGIIIFPIGITLAEITMQQPALSRAVPIVAGVVVLAAGGFQFTAWKARHLACCREELGPGKMLPIQNASALGEGVRLALSCGRCCANLMLILLVVGVMDLWAMALVTTAITAERLEPSGAGMREVIGIVVVGAGLLLIARAVGLQ